MKYNDFSYTNVIVWHVLFIKLGYNPIVSILFLLTNNSVLHVILKLLLQFIRKKVLNFGAY